MKLDISISIPRYEKTYPYASIHTPMLVYITPYISMLPPIIYIYGCDIIFVFKITNY